MKVIYVIFLSVMILVIPFQAYSLSLSSSSIEKVIVLKNYTSTAKVGVAGIRLASGLKYLKCVTGWGFVASMAATMLIDYIPTAQKAFQNWIGLTDFSDTGTGYDYTVGSGVYMFSEAVEAEMAYVREHIYTPSILKGRYPDYASASAARDDFVCPIWGCPSPYITYGNNSWSWGGVVYAIDSGNGYYYVFFYSSTYHEEAITNPATTSDFTTELAADLSGANGPERQAAAQQAYHALEKELAKAVNGEAHNPDVDPYVDAYKAGLWAGLGSTVTDALEASDENVDSESGDEDTDTEDASLYDKMKSALMDALGITDYVDQDISQTSLNPTENDTVLGDTPPESAPETLIDTEQSTFVSLMDDFMGTVSSLRNDIVALIESVFNVSGATCNFGSVPFFDSTFELSFCDVDLSVWRTAILVVFSITAVMILIV